MAVPDYQSIMLPLLQHCAEVDSEVSNNDVVYALSHYFKLTENDLKELLPSGTQTRVSNRVGWAATYLKKAGLLESTKRGFYKITSRGKDLLNKKPIKIDNVLLKQYPEFLVFQKLKDTRKSLQQPDRENDIDISSTPSEILEEAYQQLRDELAEELLEKLKGINPSFFEQIVVELLVKMGYGGSRSDAGRAIGKTGDGGLDGIIKEDKLGLDVIYIQAKRWDSNPISRPDVQQFAGALQGQQANKGIFITTSRFTSEAREYADKIGSKIVLIDGKQLSQLMIEYDVGVATASIYYVKRIDSDFFSDGI
ncbi:MAG: restriction endonuclease [Chloroflexaceae bacterium]|nr:restriction endonuclease [Chloroflexaceae bacterium]